MMVTKGKHQGLMMRSAFFLTDVYKLAKRSLFAIAVGALIIIATYAVYCVLDVNHDFRTPSANCGTTHSFVRLQNVENHNAMDEKPHFVLGILTADKNRQLRDSQRSTWMSSIRNKKSELPFKITYKFLFDKPTPEAVKEDNIYKDILFLNVTHHGKAVKLGEKLYVWFQYIHDQYPDAQLGARMDDDVFLCVPQLLSRIDSIKSGKLYYGWGHNVTGQESMIRRMDEMFVVLGKELIDRLACRAYCGKLKCKSEYHLIDTDYGGTSLHHWLSFYDDIDVQPDNTRIVQTECHTDNSQFLTPDFCTHKLIFHKASPKEMRTLHEFNKHSHDNSIMSAPVGATSGIMFSGEISRQLPTAGELPKEGPYLAVKDDSMKCNNWAVVTTIFHPSKAIFEIANNEDWCLLIVADSITPQKEIYLKNIKSKRVKYMSVEEQNKMYPLLAKFIPLKHFGRKNMGYMYAIHHEAHVIWDFDDDNIGIVNLQDFSLKKSTSSYVTACNDYKHVALNPYPYFGTGETRTWPRGFPLQLIKDETTIPKICDLHANITVGIVQSLANMQPDVDAIYRLTREVPFDFEAQKDTHKPLVLPKHAYSPFNAQATLWFSVAFAWLPLPISVSGRVSDIWRSYIAEHLMFKRNIRLAFSSPYVTQERNAHTIIKDFNAEQDLYSKSKQLVDLVSSSSHSDIVDMYRDLYKRNYIEAMDLQFIDAWQKTYNYVTDQRNESD